MGKYIFSPIKKDIFTQKLQKKKQTKILNSLKNELEKNIFQLNLKLKKFNKS